jgi:hypothetical protein
VFSGGRIEQKREIDHRRRASAMVQSEGFHFAIQAGSRKWLGRQKWRGDEENQEKGAHCGLLSLLFGQRCQLF